VTDSWSGSDWFARAIASTGTSHVFFIDAVLRRTLIALEGLGVRRVLAHTEKAVVYMADGYARASGRPAFCFAQSVGAANMAAALQDAYLARSPVVALTGRKPPSHQHRNAYQEIDHAPLFAPVTKFSAGVDQAADLPLLLRQSLRAATSASPRPVHLDLNGLQAEIIETGTVHEPPALGAELMRLPPHFPTPPAEEIARAAAKLAAARRVVIVAGAGAVQSGAGPEILALAEALQAPVATSLGGRGIIPTRHRLSAGVSGSYSASPANNIVNGADLVLFVGCHTGDQVTHGWRIPALSTPVVQVDIDPLELGRNYANTLGLLGDPKATLAMLVDAIGTPTRDAGFADLSAALVASWRGEMAAKLGSDASPIRVERLCAEITRALPDDGILVADTGYSGIWTGTCVELNGTGQTYLRAAGSLGWAFPAALGAKLAAPARKVICFSGDGAFYYHLAELETARRRGIATVTVVNNNSGFGQGWPNLLRMQGNTPGHPEEMLRFGPTDFAAVARSFGVHGIRVEEPAAIGPALAEALAMDAPVVIDVVTDIDMRAPEPWLPGGL
jgi:acetolactate synthase I/II/III large subunit